MEPKSPSKSKLLTTRFTLNPRLHKVVVIGVLVILIFGIVGVYLIFGKHLLDHGEMTSYFTVVLDCGSTGSRVNVYEWMSGNGSRDYRKFPVLLRSYPENVNKSSGCEYHCMQTEPGLHNFVNNSSQVRFSLEPLIRYAEHLVPLERRSVTPIFVLATAGMRKLAVKDVERVLGDVESVVKEHWFLYRKSWIRVLSGKEEAYYGWVALNYKMGMFGSSLRSSTLGLLDLGGSSLQVVAEVDRATKNKHIMKSKIGPIEHDIVAYSLPAFGLNEAFDRTVVMLSHSQALKVSTGGMFEIRHPCLVSGFVQNYTCLGCFPLDSRDSKNMSNLFRDNELHSVFLIGEPNWDKCKVIAKAAAINSSSLDWSGKDDRSKCIGLSSYGGNAELNLTKSSGTVTRYHALSGFFAVYRALNLSHAANLSMLWESGQRLCSTSSADRTNGQQCFRVPYLTSLIENALCLRGKQIIFGPGDVSWTLGASLIEGEFLWHHEEKSLNRFLTLKDDETISSLLVIFVLLLLLLLIVYWCQIKLPMPSRKATGTMSSTLPSYFCLKRQHN